MRYNTRTTNDPAALMTLWASHKGVSFVDHNPTTKVCSKCRQPQPLSEYWNDPKRQDGLRPQCKSCIRAYVDANKDRITAYKQEHYQQNKDRISRRSADYRAQHAEQISQSNRIYRQQNIEKIRDDQRQRYQAERDRYIARVKDYQYKKPDAARRWKRAWATRNNDYMRDKKHRRRAMEYETRTGPIDYAAIYKRCNGICHICLNPTPRSRMHYDHVIPLSKGGTHTEDNIKVSHARCNLKKGSKTLA